MLSKEEAEARVRKALGDALDDDGFAVPYKSLALRKQRDPPFHLQVKREQDTVTAKVGSATLPSMDDHASIAFLWSGQENVEDGMVVKGVHFPDKSGDPLPHLTNDEVYRTIMIVLEKHLAKCLQE